MPTTYVPSFATKKEVGSAGERVQLPKAAVTSKILNVKFIRKHWLSQ